MNKSSIPTDEELRAKLTPEQYNVVRNKATEYPLTGIYLDNKSDGTYRCVVCRQELFSSDTKYDSGTGWPSFSDTIDNKNVSLTDDRSFGMRRTAVACSNCEAHLGHVFGDGSVASGQQFCINSASLDFDKEEAS